MEIRKGYRGLIESRDAAAILGFDDEKLRLMRHRNQGPQYFKIGIKCYYTLGTIRTWLESKRVNPELQK